MRDWKELIEILEHCVKNDCEACPNHFKDGRVTCHYYTEKSVSVPVKILQEAIAHLNADGKRMPELGDNETLVMSKIIQTTHVISSCIVCWGCGQELRRTDLYCPHCGRRIRWKLSGFWEESEEGITHYD